MITRYYYVTAWRYWFDASNPCLADHMRIKYRIAAVQWFYSGLRHDVRDLWRKYVG